MSLANNYKTTLCKFYNGGKCKNNARDCDFAHGLIDLHCHFPKCNKKGNETCKRLHVYYQHSDETLRTSKNEACHYHRQEMREKHCPNDSHNCEVDCPYVCPLDCGYCDARSEDESDQYESDEHHEETKDPQESSTMKKERVP